MTSKQKHGHKDVDLDRHRETPALRDYSIYTLSSSKASPSFEGNTPDNLPACASPKDAALDWLSSITFYNKCNPGEYISIPWGVMVLDQYNGIATSFEVEVYEDDINVYELAE